MLLVNVNAAAVKPHPQKKPYRQYRQLMVAAQLVVCIIHSGRQRRTLSGDSISMCTRASQQSVSPGLGIGTFCFVGSLPTKSSTRRSPSGGIQEDLLVQPLDSRGIKPVCPLLEEKQQKFGKECPDQCLESLIVIHLFSSSPMSGLPTVNHQACAIASGS